MKRHTALLCVTMLLISGVLVNCQAVPGSDASSNQLTLEGDFDGPLGLQLWSLRNQMKEDVPGTLSKVRSWGFREVELAGTYGYSAEDFQKELEKAGLKATSMHVSYGDLKNNIDSVVQDAKVFGVEYVGTAWIPHPEGASYDEQPLTVEQAKEIAKHFNEWGKTLKEHGFTFKYHNHGYEFKPADDGTIPFDVLVQNTDPDAVKYQMDVLWAKRPGANLVKLLKKYPDRWVSMHIKDMKKGVPTGDYSGQLAAEKEVPVGQGQIDFPEVLKTAEDIGLNRYYVEDETTDPVQNIPKSLEYLQTISY